MTLDPLTHFPFVPTGLVVELDLDGDGTYAEDVTTYLRGADPAAVWIAPERGQQSEGAAAPPAQVALRFDNADRRFSPRAPMGAYYGRIGRNTPCRLSLPAISSRLVVPIDTPDAFKTTSSTITSSVSDLDVRVFLEQADWLGGEFGVVLMHQWVGAGNHRRWTMELTAAGQLAAYISSNGVSSVGQESTVVIPRGRVRQALRVTVDWNNGSGGSDWKFWTAPDLSGPWVQLGDTLVGAVLTPAASNDAPITLGATAGGTTDVPFTFLGAQVFSGREEAGGTLLVDLDLTDQTHGATSLTDATGFAWTATGCAIDRREHLMTGTVPDWQTVPGLVDDDCEVTATVTDDLRRVSGTNAPIGSAYRRGVTSPDSPMTNVRAYWPMEEPAGATSFSSAIVGQSTMRIVGEIDLASDDVTFACSDALPVLSATGGTTAAVTGAPSGATQARLLIKVPAGGVSAQVPLVDLTFTGGGVKTWRTSLRTDGGLLTQVFDAAGTELYAAVAAFALNGRAFRLHLAAEQNGADVDFTTATLDPGLTSGGFTIDTETGVTLGRLVGVSVGSAAGLADVLVGHLTVQDSPTGVYEFADQLNAYDGETAAQRVARLCSEAHLPAEIVGQGGPALGPQRSQSFVDLLREAEFGDGGILHSPRGSLGFAYRSLTSMYSRDPALTGSWDELGIVPGAAPVDDDRYAANDVTLSRPQGEYVHLVQESGPANVQDPPLGIGRYEVGNTTVSAQTVDDLAHRTGWELHLGTVDEPRLTGLTIDLGSLPYVAGTQDSLARCDAVRRVDVGDRILITDMPSWWGAPEADLLVIGVKPESGPWVHRRTFAVRPARAYRAARYLTSSDRYSVRGTVTAEALDATEAGIDITPPAGLAWGHGSGDYDIMIGGELMTVTGVTAVSGGNQTMTVVRSVNGIVKTHDTGAEVALADPCYYGI